jgi:hypothetical protein
MRPIALVSLAALVLVAVALSVTGCIVSPDWWWDDHYPPRAAAFQVTVYDYWTYMPIPWAVVELYEEDWWSWDYRGSWPVNPGGAVTVRGGYLYCDGGGPEETEYRLVARANGYSSESVEIGLDYYHPWESVYFYLVPWNGREGVPGAGEETAAEPPLDKRPPDRVRVGAPKEGDREASD